MFETKRKLYAIGHRGAMGYEPENTLASFRKAVELGTPFIELDVFFVDGHLLVFHDERLDRTTNGKGLLIDHDFAHLRSLDAGKGEMIPTLPEVFTVVADRAALNIELKGPATAQPVVEFISQQRLLGWSNEQFLVSSFKRDRLVRTRRLDPEILLGVMLKAPLKDQLDLAADLNAYSIHVQLKAIDMPLVERAHQRGLKVFAYTVNKKADLEKMVTLGVDGVFSDYPDLVAGRGSFEETSGWL